MLCLSILQLFLITYLSGCLIDIEQLNTGINQPLFLENTPNGLRLSSPTSINWKIVLDFQTNHIVISCPGLANYLIYNDEIFGDRLEAPCFLSRSGRTTSVRISKRTYDVYRFRCHKRVDSFEIAPDRSMVCGFNDSTLYKVGYIVNDELFPLIGVCHNEPSGRTHWTSHKLLGVSMSALDSNYSRPFLKNNNEELFKNLPIQIAYTPRNQRDKIASVMGKSASKSIMKRNVDMFTKSLLVPSEDFKLDTWKDVAFHFINVQFQWLPINTGLWKSLEIEIRRLSKILQQDFTVITGTSGDLRLPDSSGVRKTVSMGDDPNTLIVPNYFWKLVQDQNDACIGFIIVNFPVGFLEEGSSKVCIPCYNYGWRKLYGKDYTVNCCEYESLKNIVPELPPLKCESVLKFQSRLE